MNDPMSLRPSEAKSSEGETWGCTMVGVCRRGLPWTNEVTFYFLLFYPFTFFLSKVQCLHEATDHLRIASVLASVLTDLAGVVVERP